MRKGWKRIHRLVVLPDWQGVGIGTRFVEAVAGKVNEDGFQLNLTTTTPSFVHALCKSDAWTLARYGRSKSTFVQFEKKYGKEAKHFDNATSGRRVTYSFNYKGGENDGKQ